MAREYARLKTVIWSDKDWTDLSPAAQRVYLLALSQADMSYAGVVSYLPRRWAALSAKTTVPAIRRAVTELETAGYVVVNEDTQELLVRTFIRHDRVLAVPNVARAMVTAWRAILSAHLRDVVLAELARTYLTEAEEDRDKGWAVLMRPESAGGMREHLDAALLDRRTNP